VTVRREEMDELELLKKLDRVKAPADFELRVMARVSLEKKGLKRRRTAFRLSLAGAFASLLAVFVFLNVFVLQKKLPVGTAGVNESAVSVSQRAKGPAGEMVPVIETLDYSTEVRGRSPEPQTVYLLEQVSDTASREIRY
jgi:hypothetical protein